MTAVVGASGAGKSTLLALVEPFYDPSRGRIVLDDRDLREWPLIELRRSIAHVEQDAPVMAGSLRENLVYAAPQATDAELHEALRACRLEPLLHRLGGDLGAQLLHRGSSVSGGERQRVAIARALLRRSRLLLLDEATSQLDATNEVALRDVIEELAGGEPPLENHLPRNDGAALCARLGDHEEDRDDYEQLRERAEEVGPALLARVLGAGAGAAVRITLGELRQAPVGRCQHTADQPEQHEEDRERRADPGIAEAPRILQREVQAGEQDDDHRGCDHATRKLQVEVVQRCEIAGNRAPQPAVEHRIGEDDAEGDDDGEDVDRQDDVVEADGEHRRQHPEQAITGAQPLSVGTPCSPQARGR